MVEEKINTLENLIISQIMQPDGQLLIANLLMQDSVK